MEDKIKKSTCRVDSKKRQTGSAFWVTDAHLLTAAHVVMYSEGGPKPGLSIYTDSGERCDVEVVYSDLNNEDNPGSDMAVLLAQDDSNHRETLPLSTNIPTIGEEVVWSGFAQLFGESGSMDRQRFGWGRVASESYTNSEGTFFEIDGNFNPSHSGGPIVHKSSREVVGIVSESAGDFTQVSEKIQKRMDTVTQISQFLKTNRDRSGTYRQGFVYEDHNKAREQKRFLEGLGLEVTKRTNTNGNVVNYLDIQALSTRTSQLQVDLSEILFQSIHGTVQMGIGVASGGNELTECIPEEYNR